MNIYHIQAKIRTGDYRFSDHAVKRMIKRAINRHEIEEAILTGESVEEYPDDKYLPTCLIYGKTHEGRSPSYSGFSATISGHCYHI